MLSILGHFMALSRWTCMRWAFRMDGIMIDGIFISLSYLLYLIVIPMLIDPVYRQLVTRSYHRQTVTGLTDSN